MSSIIKVICILSFFSLMLCQSETIINSGTGITVCFTGKHTWVSDLKFYLIGPPSCNSPNIELYAKTAQTDSCNSGDDFNNFCFSTSTEQNFYICEAQTPLTGTYGSANGVPIDWSGLYGCNSATSGWKLQIYDCVSSDVGKLTGGTLQFKLNEQTILYESGAINSPINDNSCSADIASVFEIRVNCAIEFCTVCANSMTDEEKCFTCNDDVNGNAQVPNIDGSVCVLDCSLTQGCKECIANPSTVCTNCGQDANGNALAPNLDRSVCVLDCSVIQDCIECNTNPNTICTKCGQDVNGNAQVPNIDGSVCVLDCSLTQGCKECIANPNTICTKCGQDINGNAQVPNLDGSACVLDCSVTQGCKECIANPNVVCTNCGQDANGNTQVPSIDGSVCVLDCSVIQDCIECTAHPNTICTKCAQDSFGNPQVPNHCGSSCVSPCKIHNCIACKFQGTLFEKCSQCSSDQNGNLLVPAPSGRVCVKDRLCAKKCHQNCWKCVGIWNFCLKCKPGLKWIIGGICIHH